MIDSLVVHSGIPGGSLPREAVVGCFVTGGGGGRSASRVGRWALGGWAGGGLGGAPLNGVSTYSLAERSQWGLGVARDTGGGGRSGARGAVMGAGALIIGARGRCARGRDWGPP